MTKRLFVIARNPDPESSLPFLLRLPLGPDGLVLKARETWPRTARVYCHRAEEWPDDAELLEEVAVKSCARRGPAIDLVLDRARESRSQLVFTTVAGGREAIFWQTPATARRARPGARIPRRRAAGLGGLTILVDTRERYPYRFVKQRATAERRALAVGDYGVEVDDELLAVVERKSIDDLAKSLIDGGLAFAIAALASVPRAAVVVEDRYAKLFGRRDVRAGFLPDLLARVQVRYPSIPIVFCETRPLAEEWTFRFLAAARVELAGDRQSELGEIGFAPPS
jgi:ERCC4 domain